LQLLREFELVIFKEQISLE